MAKSSTNTCVLSLPLIVERWQEDKLNKRLEIARKIQNSLIRFELKKLKRLEFSYEHKEVQAQIKALYDAGKKDTSELKDLFKKRDKLRSNAGFTEFQFQRDVQLFYKYFSDNIGSGVASQGIALDVWAAFDKYFHGNGEIVHFKRKDSVNSVKGGNCSAPDSGGKEIMFKGNYVAWKELKLRVKMDPNNHYEQEMLLNRIKYCRIIRKRGKNKWRWYVQLSLEGTPAIKCNQETGELLHPIGTGAVGIDIGPSVIAYSSDTEAALTGLANKVEDIEREKTIIQRRMDRSRRAMNPSNYNEDGTIKRGVKLTRNESSRYKKDKARLAYLMAHQAEIRKIQHNELANHLISLGDQFFVEDMDWAGLAHRAKKTEKSEKTGKYKRKKRFGKSIGNRAPAMLISMLDLKLTTRGMPGVQKVPTSMCASQFNHITGECVKKSLSQRWNYMPDGKKIQRDLYSAFLLQHLEETGEEAVVRSKSKKKKKSAKTYAYNREALNNAYDSFVRLHDIAMERAKHEPHVLSSMGFKKDKL